MRGETCDMRDVIDEIVEREYTYGFHAELDTELGDPPTLVGAAVQGAPVQGLDQDGPVVAQQGCGERCDVRRFEAGQDRHRRTPTMSTVVASSARRMA